MSSTSGLFGTVTSTSPFTLYTNKPSYLVVDFGADRQFSMPGLSLSMLPHPTDGDLIYLTHNPASVLCINWRRCLNTASEQGPGFPATTRKEFIDAVCEFIDNA